MSTTNSNPADASNGLADSEDLFNFDEIVAAANSPAKTSPVDVDALLRAFDDQPPLPAVPQAAPAAAISAAKATPAAGAVPSVPGIAAVLAPSPALESARSPAIAEPRLPRKVWILTGVAIAAILLLNGALVWVSVHNAARAQEHIAALSESMLELAQRAPTQVAVPPAAQPLPEQQTEHPKQDGLDSALVVETPGSGSAQRPVPLADWDSDPRREREFERIEGLLASGLSAEARRQVYGLLARCDGLVGSAKEVVESRATFLLADTYRLEAAARSAPSAVPPSHAAPAAPTKPATAGEHR